MTLANMRENGVRGVVAACEACKREAVVNCDGMAADLAVPPDVALRPRCSACGSKRVVTRPNWRERGGWIIRPAIF